ncbi:MAG: DUF523 domain-containing protein [Magnetococcales bacterium]|nr:DUF523 domain-containing protein [Magnetococcales bacterium]
MDQTRHPATVIPVGVSACLLGREVRYDGGHRHEPWVTGLLADRFELVPVCPEVEAGLGIPRESMRLEGATESPRVVVIRTRQDLTATLSGWATGRVTELTGLAGFVFKSRSPSCGVMGVPLHGHGDDPLPRGRGLFAQAFMDRCPLAPVVEDTALVDPVQREQFIQRVVRYHRWLRLPATLHRDEETKRRWAETQEALDSVRQGHLIDGEDLFAWMKTWGSDRESDPPPRP